MSYSVHNRHRCFREVFQYFAHQISHAALYYPDAISNDMLVIRAGGPLGVELWGVEAIQAFLRTGRSAPQTLEFQLGVAAAAAQEVTPSAPGLLPTLCSYLMGYSWERYAKQISKLQPKKIFKWDADLQFYHHIRNACFHGGTFDIWDDKIMPPNFPSWSGYTIVDQTINGRRVINDGMITTVDVPRYLHDMGVAIDRVLGPLSTAATL